MRTLMLSLIATAGLALAAEPDAKRLAAMARAAATPAANADVARGYREWAAVLDEKAKNHEAEAEALAKAPGYNAMRYKWPALAAAPAERERRLAMQARRAANEARLTAEKHEARAEGKPAAGQ